MNKLITNFGQFEKLNENKSESQFITKLGGLSKSLLNKMEKKESHFIHDFIIDKIYSIYDRKFSSKKEFTENDYHSALELLKDEIEKFRESKKYKTAQEKFLEKQEKSNKKKAETEENFKRQELAAGRPYTAPKESDDDDDDDDDDNED